MIEQLLDVAGLGLPPIAEARAVGRLTPAWWLQLADGSSVLLTVPHVMASRSTDAAVSAFANLPEDLRPARFGRVTLVDGRAGFLETGSEAIPFASMTPALAAQLGRDGARWATRLAAVPAPRWGLLPGEGSFWPTSASWSEEIVGLARQHHAAARRAGTDLGPMSDALLETVRAAASALDDAESPVLVHRAIGAESLRVRDGQIVLTGWQASGFGERWMMWGELLWAPPPVMQAFLEASGSLVDGIRQPGVTQRVEAYGALRLLEQLDLAGRAPDLDGGLGSAYRCEHVAERAADLLAGDWVARRLACSPLAGQPTVRRATRGILRWALRRLTTRLGAEHLDVVAGAIAGTLLAEILPGSSERLRSIAGERLGSLGRLVCLPTDDAETSLGAVEAEPWAYARAATLAWLVGEARSILGETVSPTVVSGLRRALHTLRAIDAGLTAELASRHVNERAVIGATHGVLALASAMAQEQEGLGPLLQVVRASAERTGARELVLSRQTESLSDTVERLLAGPLPKGQDLVLAVLLGHQRGEVHLAELISPDAYLRLLAV